MRFHAHAGGGIFRLLRVRTSFIPRTSSVSFYFVGVAVVPYVLTHVNADLELARSSVHALRLEMHVESVACTHFMSCV